MKILTMLQKRLNPKKEVGMKKIGIIVLALLLALPVLSYAGSATSKWDLVVGGRVKVDMGYNTQAQGPAVAYAQPGSKGANDWANDETGNFFMGAAETALNFLIKGPDAWGAKTMAFIEGDFSGNWSRDNYGDFNLAFAFIRLDWANTSIEFGQKPTTFGFLPTWSGNLFNLYGGTTFNKGTPPSMQLMVEQRFAKNWAVKIGVINAGDVQGRNDVNSYGPTRVTNFSKSETPFVGGDITYSTDACGKVGIWKMLFSVGGFYGSEKKQYGPGTTGVGWVNDEDVDSWLIEAKAVIPIIPEKKENKKNALLIALSGFTAQNPDSHLNTPMLGAVSYFRGGTWDASAPVVSGGFGHIQYYITNNLYLNGYYGYYKQNWSKARERERNSEKYITGYFNVPGVGDFATYGDRQVGVNRVRSNQHIIANIMYDVNPALRIGFEYANIHTQWTSSSYSGNYDNHGTNHQFRVGAFYFF